MEREKKGREGREKGDGRESTGNANVILSFLPFELAREVGTLGG